MTDTIDISKIPSTCRMHLSSGCAALAGDWYCSLKETVRGKTIEASAHGHTAQEALDKAVEAFLS